MQHGTYETHPGGGLPSPPRRRRGAARPGQLPPVRGQRLQPAELDQISDLHGHAVEPMHHDDYGSEDELQLEDEATAAAGDVDSDEEEASTSKWQVRQQRLQANWEARKLGHREAYMRTVRARLACRDCDSSTAVSNLQGALDDAWRQHGCIRGSDFGSMEEAGVSEWVAQRRTVTFFSLTMRAPLTLRRWHCTHPDCPDKKNGFTADLLQLDCWGSTPVVPFFLIHLPVMEMYSELHGKGLSMRGAELQLGPAKWMVMVRACLCRAAVVPPLVLFPCLYASMSPQLPEHH